MFAKSGHWSDQKETAAGFWQLRLMLSAYRILGRKGLRFLLVPAVSCFWVLSPRVRAVSSDYLARAAAFHAKAAPSALDGLRHVISFAYSMVEKIAAWSNDIDLSVLRFRDDDSAALIERLEGGRGAVAICSHMGNVEILRALAARNQTRVARPFPVTSIVDFDGTACFNRLIREIDPASTHRLMSANELDLEGVMLLQERLEAGELVVIAGDRTAALNRDKVERVPFLGTEADFPKGVFALASLMGAPVYFIFGLRIDDLDPASPYELRIIKAKASPGATRRERSLAARAVLEEYARLLEDLSGEHPLQWYNFFDFWRQSENPAVRESGVA